MFSSVSYEFEELIRRAKNGNFFLLKDNSITTASGFGKWIFRLQHPEKIRSENEIQFFFQEAKRRELEITTLIKRLDGFELGNGYSFKRNDGWNLVYADPLEDKASTSFDATELQVNSTPIRCKPDLVLFNEKSREMMIIERKVAVTNEKNIPEHCYPNILAQLWCYSYIDFNKASWPVPKNILLVAEIWSHRNSESFDDGRLNIWMWQKNDPVFKHIRQLFELYRGKAQNIEN